MPRKTPDNIEPKAEPRAPRSGMKETELPAPDMLPAISPLGAYLKVMNISVNAFCLASGLDHKQVTDWLKGINLPAGVTMGYIEIITKGRVAIEMWYGTSIAKARLQKLIERANTEVQRQIGKLPGGGGYAAPLKKGPTGPKVEDQSNE